MKSYGQLCSIARALDVVGDRWTLLIVRELLIGGTLRFGEVQRGLPGIATNLLTQRLRDLETNGVVARARARPRNPGHANVSAYRAWPGPGRSAARASEVGCTDGSRRAE